MADQKKPKFDIFVADSIYPDAEAVFSVVPKKISDIKKDCIIVLDTNALFVPYLIGKRSLKQIDKTYSKLVSENRLVIPGQVSREFAKNRASKLLEIFNKMSQKRNSLPEIHMGQYPLLADLKDYQEVLRLESIINVHISEYRNLIGKLLLHIQNLYWDDPVSVLYNSIFNTTGVVFDPTFDKSDLEEELDYRFAHDIPPGFNDTSKSDKGVGDLLIWKTILEVGATRNKHVIFVSGEEKNDWRHKIAGQLLYPRHELVDEYRRKSIGCQFHLIQFSEFLDLFGASEQVVMEIRQQEKSSSNFYIRTTKFKATMILVESGFLILPGSQANKEVADSLSRGWSDKRNELIATGILVDRIDYYEFIEPTLFSSPSAAASVVLGRQAPGPLSWVDEDNRTYKEVISNSDNSES